ncbi:hypothetical protein ABPG74_012512 [Tetrahymena malaccensis]
MQNIQQKFEQIEMRDDESEEEFLLSEFKGDLIHGMIDEQPQTDNSQIEFPPKQLFNQPLGTTPHIPKNYKFQDLNNYIETMQKLEYENVEISVKTPIYLKEKAKIMQGQLIIFVSKTSKNIFIGKTHNNKQDQQIDIDLKNQEDIDSNQQESDKNNLDQFKIIELSQRLQISMDISRQLEEFFQYLDDIQSNFILITPKDYWLAVEKNQNCIQYFKNENKIAFPDQTLKGKQSQFPFPDYEFLKDSNLVKEYLEKLSHARKCENELNDSQKLAFDHSLRNQKANIQGPPGTGKTFLATKIVNFLIQVYKQFSGKPILVICLKNDILDELLIKINKANPLIKILRLGTRSKKDEIQQFTVANNDGPKLRHHFQNSKLAKITNQKLQELIKDLPKIQFDFKISQNLKEFIKLKFIKQLKRILLYDISIIQKIEEKIFNKWLFGKLNFQKLRDYLTQSDVNLSNLQEKLLKTYLEKQKKNIYCEIQKNEGSIRNFVDQITSFEQFSLGFSQMLSNSQHIVKIKDLINEMKTQQDENIKQKLRDKTNYQLELGEFMKGFDVIFMTITGYHMNFQALNKLGAEIALVEEASEIIESQFFTILTKNLKHLIQIGDHKQLRPIIKNQKLVKRHNYKMSFFERLIQVNGIDIAILNEQRRMVPLFANYIKIFYGEIYINAKCTKEQEIVQEISKNGMYMVQHSYPDQMDSGHSYINIYEAQYIKQLVLDLVKKKKFNHNKISVITTYLSQKILIKCMINQSKDIQKVEVYTVDEFQGKENDVILLSCVRSNLENKCGFVLNDHRINVAFSRAKSGFFLIGNFNMYALKSVTWQKIIQLSKEQFSFGGDIVNLQYRKINEKTIKELDKIKLYLPLKSKEICNFCLKSSHIGNCKSQVS